MEHWRYSENTNAMWNTRIQLQSNQLYLMTNRNTQLLCTSQKTIWKYYWIFSRKQQNIINSYWWKIYFGLQKHTTQRVFLCGHWNRHRSNSKNALYDKTQEKKDTPKQLKNNSFHLPQDHCHKLNKYITSIKTTSLTFEIKEIDQSLPKHLFRKN